MRKRERERETGGRRPDEKHNTPVECPVVIGRQEGPAAQAQEHKGNGPQGFEIMD